MAYRYYPPLVPSKVTKVSIGKRITKKLFCQKIAF